MASTLSIAVVRARRFRLPLAIAQSSFRKHRILTCGSVRLLASEATVATKRSSGKPEAKLPEHLQRIVDDYDRRQAHREEAEAGRRPWMKKILTSKYAGLFGMVSAGFFTWAFLAFDDVSGEVHTITGLILRRLSRETANSIWISAASWGVTPRDYGKDDPYMIIEPIKGKCFYNPVGLSSGFDRDARAPNAFFKLGFGFVELGPVNSNDNADAIRQRLESRDKTDQLARLGILGINLGGCMSVLKDLVEEFGRHVDFFVIDLSLVPKSEQSEEKLTKLIAGVVEVASDLSSVDAPALPVFLRLPEHWPEEDMSTAARRSAMENVHAAAMIAGATGLIFKSGNGSLSDSKCSSLKDRISDAYIASEGRLLLVADGVSTGLQALDCIEAGATLVQISSLLLTEGPIACRRMKSEVNLLLMNEGYYCLKDAVGAAHRKRASRKKNRWKPRS